MSGNYFEQKAPQLAMMGFHPLPILPNTKKPMVANWPNYEFTHEDHAKFAQASVGVLTGRDGLVVVDGDIYDPALAARMRSHCMAYLGFTIERIGAPPKFALMYRMAPTEVASKVSSPRYCAPLQPKASRLEVLGRSNYLVTHGIHPDTQQPYRWPVQDLATTPLEKLPLITPDMIANVLAFFDVQCLKAGMTSQRSTRDMAREHKPSKQGQRAADADRVLAHLATIPNTELDYDEWVRIGHAIKGAFGDTAEGLEAWLNFSEQYPGNDYDTCIAKWDSFRPDKIGAGTIVRMAQIVQQRLQLKVFGPLVSAPALREAVRGTGVAEAEVDAPAFMARARLLHSALGHPGWLVRGVVRQGKVYTLTARPGGAKTTLATYLAACIQAGIPFAGLPTQQGGVLYLGADDYEGVLDRLMLLDATTHPGAADAFVRPETCDVTAVDVCQELITFAQKASDSGAKLLALDTALFYMPNDVESENDNLKWSRFLAQCRMLTRLPGNPTVLILCHPRKGATDDPEDLVPRGGSAALAATDGNMCCWIDGDIVTLHHSAKMRGRFSELHFQLQRHAPIPGVVDAEGLPVTTVAIRHADDGVVAQLQSAEMAGCERTLHVLRGLERGQHISTAALAMQMNVDKRTAQRYLGALVDQRIVVRSPGKTPLYHLAASAAAAVAAGRKAP